MAIAVKTMPTSTAPRVDMSCPTVDKEATFRIMPKAPLYEAWKFFVAFSANFIAKVFALVIEP
jgi:hypothetical protein